MMAFKLALIQTSLHWHDPIANLANLEEQIWKLQGGTDLIVLPEMFNTGFTMQKEPYAETVNGRTWKWMKQMAQQTNAAITGSFIIKEQEKYYNRLVWMQPDGTYYQYNKHHLFTYAGEHNTYTKGVNKTIINWRGWNILPLICYDLRFPAWSRNKVVDNQYTYDLLLYVANWPASRAKAWQSLLKARAVENSCIVAGVNIVGNDGNQLQYQGGSAVWDPLLNELVPETSAPAHLECTLNKEQLEGYRNRFPFLADEDS